ncbi:MAG TPA: hypothetical protein VN837_05070, partial [Chloroflexota bacterium]|nr:hypothetical protein [Chloroflexota bacterium]
MAAALPLASAVAEPRTTLLLKATPRAWHLASVAVLVILWVLLYFRHVGDLGLYSDDWGHLQIAETDSFRAMIGNWPMDYRPLEELPWVLFHAVFGQGYGWYYAVLFRIGLVTALLLYVLVNRVTGQPLLALGAAILWTVYPADLSQFWLSGIHFRLGLLFWGLGLVLLTDRRIPANRGYVGALVCC